MNTSSRLAWDELNLKNFIHDAEKMDVKSLAHRYQRSTETTLNCLKQNGIKSKNPYGFYQQRKTTNSYSSGFSEEPLVTIRPKRSIP